MQTLLTFPWLKIFLADVAAFILQFIWFTLLFGKAWMKLSKIDPKKGVPFYGMSCSFLAGLLQAAVLFAVLETFFINGLNADWLVAVLLVSLTGAIYILSDSFYKQEPIQLFWIVGGSHIASVFLMGLILVLF